MNHITVVGNMGRDPELSYTTGGKAKVRFSVADTREYNGEKETTWHRCVAWGKTAENIASAFSKGQRVIVSGRYKMDEYTDKNNEKKVNFELLVDDCGHSIRFDLPKESPSFVSKQQSLSDDVEEPF